MCTDIDPWKIILSYLLINTGVGNLMVYTGSVYTFGSDSEVHRLSRTVFWKEDYIEVSKATKYFYKGFLD